MSQLQRAPLVLLVIGLAGVLSAHYIAKPWDLPVYIWLSAVAVCYVGRTIYFARTRVFVRQRSVIIARRCDTGSETQPGHMRWCFKKIDLTKVCRIMRLHPSARAYSATVTSQAHFEGDEYVNADMLLGFSRADCRRRLLTASTEYLIQDFEGRTIVFPVGCLSAGQHRQLWASAYEHAPRELVDANFRPPPERVQTAMEVHKAADDAFNQQRLTDAVEHYARAADHWEASGYIDVLIACLNQHAQSVLKTGDSQTARALAGRARRLARRMRDPVKIANALNNQANVEYVSAREKGYAKAIKALDEAGKLYESQGSRFLHCRLLTNQALIHEQQYRATGAPSARYAAQHAAEEAMAKLRECEVPPNKRPYKVQHARILGVLGALFYHDHCWREAAETFDEAAKVIGGDSGIAEDMAMAAHATVAWGLGLDDSDEPSKHRVGQGLALASKAVQRARMVGGVTPLLEAHALRGECYRLIGRSPAALRDYEAALTQLANYRQIHITAGIDLTRLALRYRWIAVRAVELLMRDPDARAIERAFEYAESLKARAIGDILRLRNNGDGRLPPGLLSRLDLAGRRVLALDCEWFAAANDDQMNEQEAHHDATGDEQKYQHGMRFETALEAYDQVRAEVRSVCPDYFERLDTSAPSMQSVRNLLPTDGEPAAVLAFCVCESALAVFLVMRNRPIEQTCFLIDGLGQQGLNEQFIDREGSFLAVYKEHIHYRKLGDPGRKWPSLVAALEDLMDFRLGRQLFERAGTSDRSIAQLVEKVGRLTIIPDGLLCRLPCGAWFRHVPQVACCPSAATLVQVARRAERAPRQAAVIEGGAMPYEDPAAFSQEANCAVACLTSAGVGVVRLPSAAKPVTREHTLKALTRRDWIHLCAHGTNDTESPLRSFIKLGNGSGGPADDDLRALDIVQEANLVAGATVLLSACESGLAPDRPDHESLGLPTAFLVAGASRVVSTLFEVDKWATTEIMKSIYNTLFDDPSGATLVEAMHRALAPFRDAPEGLRWGDLECRHPYFWASYIVWGIAW